MQKVLSLSVDRVVSMRVPVACPRRGFVPRARRYCAAAGDPFLTLTCKPGYS